MRILSYNIHGCIGRDGREDPGRIIELIRAADADIVGLQEVDSDDEQDRDFLRKLETLPYKTTLYGTTMRKPSADYGNLLLLRDKPKRVQHLELPSSYGEARGAIIADIVTCGQHLRIINTHLDIGIANRRQQIAAIAEHLPPPDSETRAILLGDLNEWLPMQPYFRKFLHRFSAVSGTRTFPVWPSFFALDRIALQGQFANCRFATLNSELAKLASDHRPLICDLELNE